MQYLLNLIISSDPGLLRLKMALRILMSTLIATLLLSIVATALAIPSTLSMYGVMIAMMSSLAINDPTIREQKRTFLVIPFISSAALLLGIAVSTIEWLNISIFILLIFTVVFIRRYGPRGLAAGLIIFNTYFFSLFIHASFKIFPFLLLSNFIAVPVAYMVRYYLIRDFPRIEFKNILHAFRSQTVIILSDARDFLKSSKASDKFRYGIRKKLDNMNKLSIMIEDHLQAPEDSSAFDKWLNSIVNTEVYIETLVHAAWDMKKSDSLTGQEYMMLSSALASSGKTICSKEVQIDIESHDEITKLNLKSFCWALSKLNSRKIEDIPEEVFLRLKRDDDEEVLKNRQPLNDIRSDIKQSFKSALAGGLSIFAGKMISPSRWYWAVITAYILFTSTETTGQTISKTWQRVSGTAIGLIAGIAIAEFFTTSTRVDIIVIFLFIFLAFYFFQVSYTVMIIFFTALLAMLYKAIGQFNPEIMVIRLEETLAGGIIGVLVAWFIFPEHTGKKINNSVIGALEMVKKLLERRASDRSSLGARVELLKGIKEISRELQTLRDTNKSSKMYILPFLPINESSVVHYISVLVFAFKHYLITATERETEPHFREMILEVELKLADNIKNVIEVVKGHNKMEVTPVSSLLSIEYVSSPDPEVTSRKLQKIQWLGLIDAQIKNIYNGNT